MVTPIPFIFWQEIVPILSKSYRFWKFIETAANLLKDKERKFFVLVDSSTFFL